MLIGICNREGGRLNTVVFVQEFNQAPVELPSSTAMAAATVARIAEHRAGAARDPARTGPARSKGRRGLRSVASSDPAYRGPLEH